MRIFEHPNMTNFRCPICGTKDDKPVCLIGLSGTEHGGCIEARQYHVDCLELMEIHKGNMTQLYMIFNTVNEDIKK